MSQKERRWLAGLIAATVFLVAVASVSAYKITQQYDPETGEYQYTVEVQTGDTPVRDFHLRARRGQKLKVGAIGNPQRRPTAGGAWTEMTGWNHTPSNLGSGGTTKVVSWHTSTEQASDPADPANDPVGPGNTIAFRITKGARSQPGLAFVRVTTDGGHEWDDPIPGDKPPPKQPPTTPPSVPAPVATVDPTIPDETPAPNTTYVLPLASTEPGTAWRVVLSTVLTEQEEIGVTMTDPPPPLVAHVTEETGTFDSNGEATTSLVIGASAPLGYKFYLVLVGYLDGQIDLFTGPYEITVTVP